MSAEDDDWGIAPSPTLPAGEKGREHAAKQEMKEFFGTHSGIERTTSVHVERPPENLQAATDFFSRAVSTNALDDPKKKLWSRASFAISRMRKSTEERIVEVAPSEAPAQVPGFTRTSSAPEAPSTRSWKGNKKYGLARSTSAGEQQPEKSRGASLWSRASSAVSRLSRAPSAASGAQASEVIL
jgi:hypothetical protein